MNKEKTVVNHVEIFDTRLLALDMHTVVQGTYLYSKLYLTMSDVYKCRVHGKNRETNV